MERRSFMILAGGLPLSSAAFAPTAFSGHIVAGADAVLLKSYVTNLDTRGMVPLRSIDQDTPLALRRDRNRRYDRNSIAVTTLDDRMLGYLPTDQSRTLAPLIDAGLELTVTVLEIRPAHSPGSRSRLRVTLSPAAGETLTPGAMLKPT